MNTMRHWMMLCEAAEAIDPLTLSPWFFDQDYRQGWRAMHDPARQIAAIKAYLQRYSTPTGWRAETPKGGHEIEPALLIFHMGQLYATSGNVAAAVKTFAGAEDDEPQWNNYVKASIAFLQQDRAAFERYAAPDNFNSETLDRLRRHWGQPYAEAYGASD